MFRLLSRRGRLALLLAAGVLGVTPSGAVRAASPARPVSAAAVDPGRAREIAVELAWMADPVTFRSSLRARATPAGLEIAGCVPDAAVRSRALQLARQSVTGPVLDALTVGRGVTPQAETASPEEIYSGSLKAVTAVLGPQAKALEVGTRSDGQVTLRGRVGSLEEKHAVTVQLQRVAGCTCVLNHLEVVPGLGHAPVPSPPGQTIQRVSHPAPELPKTPTTSAPVKPAGKTQVITTTTVTSPAPAPAKKWFLWRSSSKPASQPTASTGIKPAKGTMSSVPEDPGKLTAQPVPPRSLPAPVTAPATPVPLPQGMPRAASLSPYGAISMSPYGIVRVKAEAPSGENVIANTNPVNTVVPPIAHSRPLVPSPYQTIQPGTSTFASQPDPVATPEPVLASPTPTVTRPSSPPPPVIAPAQPAPVPVAEKITVPPSRTIAVAPAPVPPKPASVPQSLLGLTAEPLGGPEPIASKPTPLPAPARRTETIVNKPMSPVKPETLVTLPTPARKTETIPIRPAPMPAMAAKVMPMPTPPRAPIVTSPVVQEVRMPAERPAPRGGILGRLFRRNSPSSVGTNAIPDRPYVTTGTVIFHDTPPPLPPTRSALPTPPSPTVRTSAVALATTPAQDGLRQKVMSACGGEVRNVLIKAGPNQATQVKIQVSERASIETILGKVMQVPEMTAPQVQIAFETVP